MKRLFDIFFSTITLLLLLPLFLVLFLLIRLESKGPAVFKQKRVGLHCKAFTLFKFRTMVENAEQIGAYHTVSKDSRITRVGSFLRKTSLDELPQLLNVLRNEMSLVGPRPDLFVQQKNYTDIEWQKRHDVLPGITGLAQAKLRSLAGHEERLRLDLEYVANSSLLLDIKIILLTLRMVIVGKGSN